MGSGRVVLVLVCRWPGLFWQFGTKVRAVCSVTGLPVGGDKKAGLLLLFLPTVEWQLTLDSFPTALLFRRAGSVSTSYTVWIFDGL
jgi:hypothetical protein